MPPTSTHLHPHLHSHSQHHSGMISLELKQRSVQDPKQLQRLIMSKQMQQAIRLLQTPVMELSPVIEMEIKQNPVLDYMQEGEEEELEPEMLAHEKNHEKNYEKSYQDRNTLEGLVRHNITLFEYLMHQASEQIKDPEDLRLAEALIGNLDNNGFLTLSIEEIAALEHTREQASLPKLEALLSFLQTLHPPGIGARNIQECLLIQLAAQGKKNELAYAIIEKQFDHLLHNRIRLIAQHQRCTRAEVEKAIDDTIAKLEMYPASRFSSHTPQYIVPDLHLIQEGEQLVARINEESMPRLRLNPKYLHLLEEQSVSKETKEFIHKKVRSAKWLLRNILQRNDTLEKIALSLAKRQREFLLNPEGALVPLTMKAVADELQMHESTIARAVSNKYIDTPRGLLSLRFFFTNRLKTHQHEVSANTARQLVKEIICGEQKEKPLSDSAISELLKEKGILCARRTVAKYRTLLKVGNAQQRRRGQ
jgi:RNA polymerase sigma-54 factor